MVVICTSCGQRHNIPFRLYEDRFRGRLVVIGCKQCGGDIRVDGTERVSSPPSRPASTPPKPGLTPITRYLGASSPVARSIPPGELDWSTGDAAGATEGNAGASPAEGSEPSWLLLLPDGGNRELNLTDLLKAMRAGEVSTGNLVWRAGMAEWRPISQVPELTPYLDSLQDDEPTRSEGPHSKRGQEEKSQAEKSQAEKSQAEKT
jgi:hypothetical protein